MDGRPRGLGGDRQATRPGECDGLSSGLRDELGNVERVGRTRPRALVALLIDQPSEHLKSLPTAGLPQGTEAAYPSRRPTRATSPPL